MKPGRIVLIAASLIALALAGIRLPKGVLSDLGAQRVSGGCTLIGANITCDGANDTASNLINLAGQFDGAGGDDSLTNNSIIGNSSTSAADGFFGASGNDTLINNGTVRGQIGMEESTADGDGGGLDSLVNNNLIIADYRGMSAGIGDTVVLVGTIQAGSSSVSSGIHCDGLAGTTVGCLVILTGSASINAPGVATAIVTEDGNDTINIYSGTVTSDIITGGGNDSIGVFGNEAFVNGVIDMGPGSDTLENVNRVPNLLMGDGNDSVYNDDGDTIAGYVRVSTGNDTITNRGSIAGVVSLGDGADSLFNYGPGTLPEQQARIVGGVFGDGGNDTIVNSLNGYIVAIDGGTGNDSIRNHSLVAGVLEGGADNDNVTNFAGGLAHGIGGSGGSDSVSNGGALNSSIRGGVGQDTVTNFAGAVASWLNGDEDNDRVLNGGFVNADLNGGAGNDSVVNLAGAFVSQIYGDAGLDTVINAGFLNGTAWGGDDNDIVTNLGGAQATNISGDYGNDSVFNGGYLVGLLYGGEGNDTVVNAAFSYSAGADLGGGDDQFINGGYLNGNITCGAGSDQLSLVAPSYMAGSVSCGSGNDTVYLLGGTVVGLIDGGADSDAITFQFTYSGNASQVAAIQAAFAVASPAGGTITIGAQTFTWTNFEFLFNLMNLVTIEPGTEITITIPRRANGSDVAAPVAVYCAAVGVELWAVGADGAGSYAFSVPYADLAAGTTASGSGATLESTGGGSFVVSATEADGKPYSFTGSCG